MVESKQSRRRLIVASTLAVATLVSGAAATMPAMAVQARSATSQTMTVAATDMLSAAELKWLNDNKGTVSSMLIPGFDPATTDYYNVPKDKIASAAGMIPMAGSALASAPITIDTAKSGYLVDGKVSQTAPASGDVDYQVAITGKTSGATVLYTAHSGAKPTTGGDNGNGDTGKPLTGDVDGDGKYTSADLKDIKVAYDDGSPISGFDYRASGPYPVESGRKVTVTDIPSGWTTDDTTDGQVKLLDPDGNLVITYMFKATTGKIGDTDGDGKYTLADLKGMTVHFDGKTIDGFDPTKPGESSIPKGVTSAGADHAPDGWNAQPTPVEGSDDWTMTVTDPDGVEQGTWTFKAVDTPTTDPDKPDNGDTDGDGEYTADDLKGMSVTVTVDGKGSPLADWDPANTKYTIPAGATVVLNDVPEGWTMQEQGAGVFDLTSPDGAATFTYTFTPEGSPTPDPDKPGNNGDNGNTTDPDKPGNNGDNGTDNGGSDTAKPTVKPLSIDLSKDTTSGHGVYVTDGDAKPKGDKASDPLYGAWDTLKPGTYTITYKQAGEGGEFAQSVQFTHRENATVDKDGIIDLGDPVKENSLLNVKDASYTSDTVDPATVTVTVKEGDVLLFPASTDYTFGTVTFTPQGSGADQNQNQQGGTDQNQKPGSDQNQNGDGSDQNQKSDSGKDTQTPTGDGNTLPATGVNATGVGVGSLIALLMAGLAMLGIKRRA